MAIESDAPLVDPNIVGNAFVQKYYNHLYESPAEVHRFYLEDSVLGRPDSNGEMVSVNSLKAINDQIMSFDYENSKIQILTADSQASFKNGVVTLVTGLLTEKDGKRMKFSQSFFLVPQKGSYFVLNDVFRYVFDEFIEPEANKEIELEVEETPQADKPITPILEHANVVKQITETSLKKPESDVTNGHLKTREEELANGECDELKSNAGEAPKKSFAVIVQSLAQNGAKFNKKSSVPKPKPKPELKAPEASPMAASGDFSAEKVDESARGGTIFVANLHMDATPEQLYETFKGFGDIKKDGIQVRSYRFKGNCFGFVTFESVDCVKSVLQAHREMAIRIGNRRVSIEEKRGNNENGRPATRNNGYRSRGSGGRGYGRNGNGSSSTGEVRDAKGYDNGTVRGGRENGQFRG